MQLDGIIKAADLWMTNNKFDEFREALHNVRRKATRVGHRPINEYVLLALLQDHRCQEIGGSSREFFEGDDEGSKFFV